MKKILVTGCSGFIGASLAEELLNRNYGVVGIDNLSQGRKENMHSFASHPNFKFMMGDIQDKNFIFKAVEGCSAIFHLAAYKIPRYTDALDTLRINGIGTDIIAQAAVESEAYLIAASTSDIYGKNPNLPFDEESDSVIGCPMVKRWSYAISKMFLEQLLFAYHERYGIDVSVVRFFGGYGPKQHLSWWGGPQAVFIEKALEDDTIELHGDGQQTRTFTYISDHVDGLIRILECEQAKNQTFNLGSTQEVTIETLARKIWSLVRGNEEPKLRFIPYESFGRYEDVRRRIPNLKKAEDILGYKAKTNLDTGLQKTIAWQKQARNILCHE